jgi:propanol-preferring alcohol dehydrogenase
LRLRSGTEIIAVDLDDAKLNTARESGAAHAINARDPEVSAKILEISRGVGVSAAFDFVGADSTLDLAMATTRPVARVVQVGWRYCARHGT